MFDLPDAKRVRRSELYNVSNEDGMQASHSEAESLDDTSAADLFRQRMSGVLNLDAQETKSTHGESEHGSDNLLGNKIDKQEEDEGFEFNLFAPEQDLGDSRQLDPSAVPSSAPPKPQQRIRLSPDTSTYLGSQKVLQSRRSLSYYFTPDSDEEAHRRFKSAALDADFIRGRAAQPWPDGRLLDLKKPWRVTVWTASPLLRNSESQSYVIQSGTVEQDKQRKRTRVGKKTRMRRRIAAARRVRKDEAKAMKKEEEIKRQAEKEDHMRKKKSEMNRKKQIRKREKERERKAAEEAKVDHADT